ncbi:DUF3231 family protein [Brevibacillus dissolubilis]|uniref:DUF3231 family protein n=1 Tax=Brevibacillus dissolubilis TaxID=1844116 RepID=UPI00159B9C02|nr:DUF3231 family protein [Brevibacillus dissolubilis]
MPMTSAEIGNLWMAYMANSMGCKVLSYFNRNVEDEQIGKVISDNQKACQVNLARIKEIFEKDHFPIPIGFTDEDVHLDAPRLFSDTYYLYYLKMITGLGSIFYTIALPTMAREDVRGFITDAIHVSAKLFNEVADVMLEKGVYVRPPVIPYPEHAEFVETTSFFNGFFSGKRPLNSAEIGQLFANLEFNTIKIALLTGFSQVAQSQTIREYFYQGIKINKSQIGRVSNMMLQENIPPAIPFGFTVTNSTTPPFSDKLMLFHVSNFSAAKLRNFGDSIAVSPRHDLARVLRRKKRTAWKVWMETHIADGFFAFVRSPLSRVSVCVG